MEVRNIGHFLDLNHYVVVDMMRALHELCCIQKISKFRGFEIRKQELSTQFFISSVIDDVRRMTWLTSTSTRQCGKFSRLSLFKLQFILVNIHRNSTIHQETHLLVWQQSFQITEKITDLITIDCTQSMGRTTNVPWNNTDEMRWWNEMKYYLSNSPTRGHSFFLTSCRDNRGGRAYDLKNPKYACYCRSCPSWCDWALRL